MSSSTPEHDTGAGEKPAVPGVGADDFVDALLKGRSDLAASGKLEDINRIRSAFGDVFDDALGDMLGDEEQERPTPRFPGFTILEKAGQGGFGAVYRARDEKLDREVALKVLLPRFQDEAAAGLYSKAKERFLNEARALARVRHPNVLTIHSVLEAGGRVALVTEFIHGQPLSEALEQNGPLSAAEAAQAGAEICRALAAVHAAGLVHRDVKTPNVLRERGGRIVLADFGLGVFLAEGKDVETCGFVAGSPLFMAPEQIRGEELRARMDLYSLGVVLFNLSTGKFPVTARSLHELFGKIKTGTLIPLRDVRPDLPEAFTQAVTKALALDPERRFQTAGEMEQALLACVGTAPAQPILVSAEPSQLSVLPKARPAMSRRTAIFASALTAAALLVTAMFFGLAGGDALYIEANPLLNGRPIADGDRVKVGDGVALSIKVDKPAFVYAIDQDDTGQTTPLFPRPDISLKNPLTGGMLHELPGGGKEWEVTSRGGAECILVIASLEPLKEVEGAMEKDALTEDVVTRSITRLKPKNAGPSPAPEGSLAHIVEEMKRSSRNGEQSKGLWIRKITLRNP